MADPVLCPSAMETLPAHDTRALVAGTQRPAHVYPSAALSLLMLKCPTIRRYCSNGATPQTSGALRSGLNRTLAPFEGGRETAHHACSRLPGFVQQDFDEMMVAGRQPATPCYTCAQARTDGSSTCPASGCPLPDGSTADAPLDLLIWDCNLKGVGQPIIAKSIIASEFGTAPIAVRDKIFAYERGIFREVDEHDLYNKIMLHLGITATIRDVTAISKLLTICGVRRIAQFTPNPNYICFRNGTLNVETGQQEAHSSGHMLLNRIEHDFTPEAGCPTFMQFLRDVWPDTDQEAKIAFFRQWLGYLLVADASMQKMLVLLGEGANGKSVLMDVTKSMVGTDNTATAMLHRLKMPYVRATMESKLLNQSADLPKLGIVADGDLKAIVSGDPIEVAPKFKASYTIKPYTRLMVATNNLPSSKDTTHGYFRRIIILPFNRQFGEHERNPRLLQTLLSEMNGIIAWAVEGLYELRRQGRFTIPPSSDAASQAYQENISPVRMFANDCLAHSPDRSGFTARDIFLAFRAWCRDRGFDAGNMVSLGRELSSLGFTSRKSSTTLWLVTAKESGMEYFHPAQLISGSSSSPATAMPVQEAA